MQNESRIDKSIRNTRYALVSKIIGILVMFACRTVFIRMLSAEYLGVSGLFGNIMSLLSLTEFGLGGAILVSLYKPLTQKDEKAVMRLMNFYRLAYKIIGILVVVFGLMLVPFLTIVMKETPSIPSLTLIYLLYVFNSASSYFMAYKSILLEADQNGYLLDMYNIILVILQNGLQIIVLLLTQSFILYLCIQNMVTIIENIIIAKKANALYPFLKQLKGITLLKEEKKLLYKYIGAMMSHEVGNIIVNGTDSLLISSFVGVIWVGLYANYLLIVSTLQSVLGQVFGAVSSSIGHMNAIETGDRPYQIFKSLMFLNFWLYGFCTVCLWVLFEPFIRIWAGDDYVLDTVITLIIVFNFYIGGMRTSTLLFRDSLGLFWNDRFKPIVEVAINLIASIILMKKFGIVGVLIGTLISTLTTSFWVEPFILFKNSFPHKKLRSYFGRYTTYFIITAMTAVITKSLASLIPKNGILFFIFKVGICLLLPNLIFFVCFFATKEFKYLYSVFKNRFVHSIQS